ncbi:MAG: DUF2384 domain-containing protein [Gemmatimonadetes bacterium]|nr:DUF2384 domain-containing protein [Gemmatimonadota bacterium]MBA4158795.1 DUF2384 domain-containing protein [Gemmatimonadota bacterium]
MVDAGKVAEKLGGKRLLGSDIHTTSELRVAVEEGLPVESLDFVVHELAENTTIAVELKHRIVPKTTLQRRKRLSMEESQRLERLARITALAEEVWADKDLAHEFLTSPQPQLEGERPIDLARSELGAREVEALLMKIEYALPV